MAISLLTFDTSSTIGVFFLSWGKCQWKCLSCLLWVCKTIIVSVLIQHYCQRSVSVISVIEIIQILVWYAIFFKELLWKQAMPQRVCNPDLAKYGKYVCWQSPLLKQNWILDNLSLSWIWQHLFIKWVQMVSLYERPWFCFVLKRGKCISLTPYVGGHSQPFQGTDGIFRLHKISLAPRVPLRFYPVKPCTISCTPGRMWCTFWFLKIYPPRFYSPHVWADLRDIGSSQTRSRHTTMITISLIPNIWISRLNKLLEFRCLSSHFWTENRKSNIWRLLCWGQWETAVHMMDDMQDVLWHSGASWLRPKNNRDMKRDSRCRALHFDKRETFDFLHTVVGKRSRSVSKERRQCK